MASYLPASPSLDTGGGGSDTDEVYLDAPQFDHWQGSTAYNSEGEGVRPNTGGDVFQYNEELPTTLPVDDQGLRQGLVGAMVGAMGGTPQPDTMTGFLQPMAREMERQNERQRQDLAQALQLRGMGASTVGDQARADLQQRQQDAMSKRLVGAMTSVAPTFANTYNTLQGQQWNQNLQQQQQDLANYFSFYDRFQQLDQARKNRQMQGLAMMLNAVGQNTIQPTMPNFMIPESQPGLGQSLGNIGGNILTSLIQNPNFNPSWMPGN